jgi:hypothetical protein
MADYDTLTLVGRHVPEEGSGPFENMNQATAAGHDVLNPVTGMYEIGALIDGAFVPIVTEKASLVFDAIELAKTKAATDQAPAEQPPAEQPPTADQPQG